jgi:hypothetical protein
MKNYVLALHLQPNIFSLNSLTSSTSRTNIDLNSTQKMVNNMQLGGGSTN